MRGCSLFVSVYNKLDVQIKENVNTYMTKINKVYLCCNNKSIGHRPGNCKVTRACKKSGK